MRLIITILSSSLRSSVPLILAATGGTFSSRSGVSDLGLEGMMLFGAFFGVYGSYISGSAWVGLLFGAAFGAISAMLHAVMHITYRVNASISGMCVNLLATAATPLLLNSIFDMNGKSAQVAAFSRLTIDALEKIPFIGPIRNSQTTLFYLTIALVVLGWVFMYKTTPGLRMRMVGENPKAAATMGLRVHGIKYCGVLICGALAGLGGAYLSLDQLDMFVRNMTAGRDYIAVAIAILGRYNPATIVPCALLFGFCDAVQIYLQGEAFPPQIVQMLPYIVTLLVLAFGVKHIKPPAGVGKYDDE